MRRAWAPITLIACLLFAGCGGGSGGSAGAAGDTEAAAAPLPRELTVTLDGWEGPAMVGLLIAYQRGFFTDEGLAPAILVSGGGAALKYVAQGGAQLAVVHQPQIISAADKGAKVTAIGSLVPRTTAAMIWDRDSGIHGIPDLRGRTIGIEGLPYQRLLLERALARGGLTLDDVHVEKVEYDLLPALASGRVDAIFGGSANLEGAALRARGIEPVVVPARKLGLPPFEDLVVAARRDFAAEDRPLVADFMAAVARGTAVAIRDPGAAVDAVEAADEADPDLSKRAVEAEVRATVPLLSRTAFMSPRRARRLIDWMKAEGLIARRLQTSAVLTNAYR